jgi:lysophospholipase L1-like esterase
MSSSYQRKATLVLAALVFATGGFWYYLEQRNERSIVKSTTPASYDPARQIRSIDRHARLKAMALSHRPRILLIGDSLTERWEHEGRNVWNRVLAPREAFNAGVDNDRTENLLWRINDGALEFKYSPEICILLIGINNLAADSDTPQGVTEGIRSVATAILSRYPHARLIIVGLLPCGPRSYGMASRRARTNRRLAGLHLPRTEFLDLSPKFINDSGGIYTHLSTDSIHLSEEGYRVLAESLAPHL